MRIVIAIWALVFALSSLISVADEEVEVESIDQIYLSSNDYLDLVRKYWPRATNGDLSAMKLTYRALNNCWTFKDEISTAKNIDELDVLMREQHANNLIFAKGEYFQCKDLVEHYAEFLGWRRFRLDVALGGDMQARIIVALDFYRLNNKRPREDFPFSPAAYLIDAMNSRNYLVFGLIATSADSHSILQNLSQTTITAWWLLSCKYYDDCRKPESMASLCSFLVPACAQFENIHEKIRHDAGSEEIYTAAQSLSDELDLAIQERRFDDLGLNLVW